MKTVKVISFEHIRKVNKPDEFIFSGVEDDIEAEEVESKTPPRAARSSIAR